MKLSELPIGAVAQVTGFSPDAGDMEAKLREIGFAEGDEVELMQRGPLGGAPISVRLNRTQIALRKGEAAFIEVAKPS